MWEYEKSQPAVKPKSNIWAWNRRQRLSAVDCPVSASIKSWCQSEHEQEIASLERGGKNGSRLYFHEAVMAALFLWFTSFRLDFIHTKYIELLVNYLKKNCVYIYNKDVGIWRSSGFNFSLRHLDVEVTGSNFWHFGEEKKTSCTNFPARTFLKLHWSLFSTLLDSSNTIRLEK